MLELKRERLINYYQGQNLSERQVNNRMKKEELKEEEEKGQKEIEEMTLNVTWKKSRTWGNCPRIEGKIKYKDGTYGNTESYYASGCGYCKESTIIASAFNEVLKYKLWEIAQNTEVDRKKIPYGISLDDKFSHHFMGGVGTECYYKITEYLGGKFENIANGKTFDVYKVTF